MIFNKRTRLVALAATLMASHSMAQAMEEPESPKKVFHKLEEKYNKKFAEIEEGTVFLRSFTETVNKDLVESKRVLDAQVTRLAQKHDKKRGTMNLYTKDSIKLCHDLVELYAAHDELVQESGNEIRELQCRLECKKAKLLVLKKRKEEFFNQMKREVASQFSDLKEGKEQIISISNEDDQI